MLEIIYAVAIGLGMATTAMVARRVGEKDDEGAVRAAVQAIVIGVVMAAILGLAGAIWAPTLLGLMGASPETVAMGSSYTRVLYGGMATVLLLFLNNAIYRGAGDATTAMHALWIANGINLVLDPCLIFGLGPFPEMGLAGAAVATTIGRGTGVLYQLWGFRSGSRIRISRKDLKVDPSIIVRLVRLSVGGVSQLLVATASYVVLIRILAGYGSAVLAGYVVAIRTVIFIILPAWGLSNAAATLVGQNLGAAKPDRAERAVWITGLWNMAFMALVTVLFVGFSRPIVEVFTTDPEASPIGVEALTIISYGYVFYAWGMVMMQAFNGAGDTATPTKINIVCFWLFEIPLAYALAGPMGMGPTGVFWAISLSYSLSAVIGVVLFRRGKWKLKKV
jgi:putative MATE family efflux protein